MIQIYVFKLINIPDIITIQHTGLFYLLLVRLFKSFQDIFILEKFRVNRGIARGEVRTGRNRMPITRSELSPGQGTVRAQGPREGMGGKDGRGRWTESRAYLIYLPDNAA